MNASANLGARADLAGIGIEIGSVASAMDGLNRVRIAGDRSSRRMGAGEQRLRDAKSRRLQRDRARYRWWDERCGRRHEYRRVGLSAG